MKKYRLLLSGLVLAMICGMTLYSCQENDLAPESEARLVGNYDAVDFAPVAETEEEETDDLVFLPGTDEVMSIYEEGGEEALVEYFLKKLDSDVTKPKEEPEQLYCNYKVVSIVAPDQPITPYPGPGKRFCVVCPPFCTLQGFLVSRNPVLGGRHYIAYCERNQDGPGCFRCNDTNCIYPRA